LLWSSISISLRLWQTPWRLCEKYLVSTRVSRKGRKAFFLTPRARLYSIALSSGEAEERVLLTPPQGQVGWDTMIAVLHIHNGDSTAGTARQANIPGEHLAWREALVCGPAPGHLSEAEFIDVRAKHLADAYGVAIDACKSGLQRQHDALMHHPDHDEVVLWFEHELFCQIQLAYLLDWFSRSDLGRTTLSLVSISAFAGINDFRGLGQLNGEQLASLFPARTTVTSRQLELGSRAWQAYTSTEPTRIESLLTSDTSALPFLKSALSKHLQRFPSVRNGLGRIGNVCLKLIEDGQGEFKSLFPAFGRREPLYGFGDAQVFMELKRLANAPSPQLVMNDNDADAMDARQLLETSFELTGEGRAVINGGADFVRLNGIDTWLGGVHLHGDDAKWRWDDEAETLTKS